MTHLSLLRFACVLLMVCTFSERMVASEVSKVEIIDGVEHIYKRVPEHMKDMPTFAMWADFLKSRNADGASYPKVLHSKVQVGRMGMAFSSQRLSSHSEQRAIVDENQQVKLLCLCCGDAYETLHMTRITIGCVVRMKDMQEERDGDKTRIIVGAKMMPVSKSGQGCAACADLFAAATAQVQRENADREYAYELAREIWTLKYSDDARRLASKVDLRVKCERHPSMPALLCGACKFRRPAAPASPVPPPPTAPKLLTPWIDVTEQVTELAEANKRASEGANQ